MFVVVSMSRTTEAAHNSENRFACICERNSSIPACTERQKNELIPRKSIKFNHMLQFTRISTRHQKCLPLSYKCCFFPQNVNATTVKATMNIEQSLGNREH